MITRTKNVYIAQPDVLTSDMFTEFGWTLTRFEDLDLADLICFTGGADVTPSLYHSRRHPETMSSMVRDLKDKRIFDEAAHRAIPMVGICRGGQFLNVMNGGTLFQHVDGHATGHTHQMEDVRTGKRITVTSTHHQMMIPGPGGVVIGTARQSTCREWMHPLGEQVLRHEGYYEDVEVVWYPDQNILCYQPHPEYPSGDAEHFFATLETTICQGEYTCVD